jgi:DNA repair protein RadC
MSIPQWPAGEAPREKLYARGVAALSDAELLAVLLGSGVRGCSVDVLARRLLLEFDGLRGVLAADHCQMTRVAGMGPARHARLQVVLEIARRTEMEGLREKQVLTNPNQAQRFLGYHLGARRREVFCCLFLDSQHALICCEDLFLGTLDGAAVYPREVVTRALLLGSAAVICAHNHPSGVAEPSQADRRITERLQAALALVDIRILDHIIVGRGRQFSFAEAGLL